MPGRWGRALVARVLERWRRVLERLLRELRLEFEVSLGGAIVKLWETRRGRQLLRSLRSR